MRFLDRTGKLSMGFNNGTDNNCNNNSQAMESSSNQWLLKEATKAIFTLSINNRGVDP